MLHFIQIKRQYPYHIYLWICDLSFLSILYLNLFVLKLLFLLPLFFISLLFFPTLFLCMVINESDHNRLQSITDNIKRVGGNVAKSLLDKYHESIFRNLLNFTSDMLFSPHWQKNIVERKIGWKWKMGRKWTIFLIQID